MIAQLLSRPDQNEPVFEIVKDPDVHFPSRGKDALHDLREDTGRQGEPEGVNPVLSCPTLEHKPWERSVSKKERASLYNLWMGDADDSSKWRRFAGTSAPQTTLSSWVMS